MKQHVQNHFHKNCKDSDKQSYLVEMTKAARNVHEREVAFQGYYSRQAELKSGIKYDYQDIGNLLKEFNILSANIKKHNKEFGLEIIKIFPEFFKVERSESVTSTSTTMLWLFHVRHLQILPKMLIIIN